MSSFIFQGYLSYLFQIICPNTSASDVISSLVCGSFFVIFKLLGCLDFLTRSSLPPRSELGDLWSKIHHPGPLFPCMASKTHSNFPTIPRAKWPKTLGQKDNVNSIKCEQMLDLPDMDFKLTVFNPSLPVFNN